MTQIEWATKTWEPVKGCTKVSAGCLNCYAERLAAGRLRRFYPEGFCVVRIHRERLDEPLHWRKPQRIFVCSRSDLFHRDVGAQFLYHVWSVMRASRHTFLILTKRPDRMRAWIAANNEITVPAAPNVWLGVSAENQACADERIPLLLQTPAAVRFVSLEPLLEEVDIYPWLGHLCVGAEPTLDWVIVGGESGPCARPASPHWLSRIVTQCRMTSTPLFVKQLGTVLAKQLGCRDRRGAHPDDWPTDLRVREFPR